MPDGSSGRRTRANRCSSLVNVLGAYATTARCPEPVTQALPIHWSVSNPGSARVAAVRHA